MSPAVTTRPEDVAVRGGTPPERAVRFFERVQTLGLLVLLIGLPVSEALKSIGLALALLGFVAKMVLGDRPRFGSPAVAWALLAYFVVAAVSFAATQPELRRPDGLLATGMVVAPFFLVADLCRRPGRQSLMAWAVVLGCAAASIEGLFEYAGGTEARLSLGSIENAVPAAEYLAACLTFTLGLLLGTERSRWSTAAVAAVCLMTIVALMFTGSRGPTTGAAGGAVLVLAVGLRRRVYAALLLVSLLVVSVWFAVANPESRMSGAGVADSHSADFRISTWERTAALIAERPLLGHGPGTFADLGVDYEDSVWSGPVRNAHNVWLQTACETGILGAGALVLFLVLGTGVIAGNTGRKRGLEKAISVGVLGAVASLLIAGIFSVSTDAEPGMLLFALMALGQ
jgi:O-antigen ligase